MEQLTLEVEIKNNTTSYSSPAFQTKINIAPYDPSYRRTEDSRHAADQRLVFLAPTLQSVLATDVLGLLTQFMKELAPTPVELAAAPEDEDVEVEDKCVKVERIVTFRLKGGKSDALTEFGSSLDLRTDRNLDRERTRELVDITVKPLIKRLVELLVINEIIETLPDEVRLELPADVQAAVDDAAEARARAWQLHEKLEALRSAKEAKERAQQLEDQIRAELSPQPEVRPEQPEAEGGGETPSDTAETPTDDATQAPTDEAV